MSVRRSVFFTVLERHVGFAIQFVANVIIARLLTPAEVGVYSVCIAMLALVYVVREFGITAFIIQERDLTEAKIRTAFGLMILISWSMAAAAWFGRGLAADIYGDARIAAIIGVLTINFVTLPFGQPARGLLNRAMRFRALTLIDIASAAASATTSIAFSWLGHGPISLAYGSVCGTTTAILLTLCFHPDHLRLMPSLQHWRPMLAFGSFSTGASLITALGANAAELVMGRVLDLASVGLYSRGNGLVSLLQQQLPTAFARVAFPGFAEMLRKGKEIERAYLIALGHITGFLWPAYAFLALVSEPLIGFLFGDRWLAAAPVARVLCAGGALHAMIFLVHSVYSAHGAVRRRFAVESIVQSARIAAIIVAAPFGLVAVAIAQVGAFALSAIVSYIGIRHVLRIGLRNLIGATWRSAVVSTITGLFVAGAWMISDISEENHFARLGVAIASGAPGWWIGLELTRHGLVSEFRRLFEVTFRQFLVRGQQ